MTPTYHGGQAGDTGEEGAGGDAGPQELPFHGVRDEKQGGVYLTPRRLPHVPTHAVAMVLESGE